MTDIAITYEDGLRLSELQGQLAQLQYDLAHVDMTVLGERLAILFLMLCVMAFLLVCIDSHFDGSIWCRLTDKERDARHKRKILCYSVVIVLAIVVYACLWIYVGKPAVIDIESQMTNVQGQMDAIYAKYGGA